MFPCTLGVRQELSLFCPEGTTSTEKLALEKMPGKTQKKIKCFFFQKSECFQFKSGN